MFDPVSAAIQRSGLPAEGRCLHCKVCCRFPLPASPLAPYFSNAEIEEAVAAGMPRDAFPPGTYGPGHSAHLVAQGETFCCPAFRPSSNDCAVYAARPLDCRLYPFMLMYDREGRSVLLGLDSLCPATQASNEAPAWAACAAELARLLDGELRAGVVECRGIAGAWKEHVQPSHSLPNLTRALCRDDLGLARAVPTAQATLIPFFQNHGGNLSYHAFAPIYVWSDLFDLRYKVCGDRLLIFAEGDGDCFLICPPLGAGQIVEPAREAADIMGRLNPRAASPRIQDADEISAKELVRAGWRVRESHVEYLYARADLAELRGNKYEKKRQLCNRFEREHKWAWRPFDAADLPPAMALHRAWLKARTLAHPGEIYAAQAEASCRSIYRGLREADALGLVARVLEADGRMVGFTVGCALHDLPDGRQAGGRTFHVLFEISDLGVRGAAQFMFREFCREMSRFEFINAGSASGLANLARVKESYRPKLQLSCHTLIPPSAGDH